MSETATIGNDVFLQNLWDEPEAAKLASRTRSNCCATARTCSAPICASPTSAAATPARSSTLPDPLTGEPSRVLAVKGSGGDLRSIGTSGFAVLYLDKLEQLIARYRGEAHEDEMVGFYPLCAFGENRVAASIDTPLHAFLPFDARRSPASGLGDRAGGERQRRAEAARSSTAVRPRRSSGCRGSGPASSSR